MLPGHRLFATVADVLLPLSVVNRWYFCFAEFAPRVQNRPPGGRSSAGSSSSRPERERVTCCSSSALEQQRQLRRWWPLAASNRRPAAAWRWSLISRTQAESGRAPAALASDRAKLLEPSAFYLCCWQPPFRRSLSFSRCIGVAWRRRRCHEKCLLLALPCRSYPSQWWWLAGWRYCYWDWLTDCLTDDQREDLRPHFCCFCDINGRRKKRGPRLHE